MRAFALLHGAALLPAFVVAPFLLAASGTRLWFLVCYVAVDGARLLRRSSSVVRCWKLPAWEQLFCRTSAPAQQQHQHSKSCTGADHGAGGDTTTDADHRGIETRTGATTTSSGGGTDTSGTDMRIAADSMRAMTEGTKAMKAAGKAVG